MNKINKLLVVLVIILMVLLLSLGGYIIYDKTSNKSNDNISNNTKLLTNEEALIEGRKLYDKATEIYETWVMLPYCGITLQEIPNQEQEILGDSGYGNGRYYKSNFNSLEDLKNYLKQWLSESIIENKVVKSYEHNGETHYKYVEDISLLSNHDDHYSYVNYVLKDNTIYCRVDTGKGWLSLYQNEYDIKVNNIEENKITYTITSTYCKEHGIDNCSGNNLEYKNTNFTIEKNKNGNFVVTEYTLHN